MLDQEQILNFLHYSSVTFCEASSTGSLLQKETDSYRQNITFVYLNSVLAPPLQ